MPHRIPWSSRSCITLRRQVSSENVKHRSGKSRRGFLARKVHLCLLRIRDELTKITSLGRRTRRLHSFWRDEMLLFFASDEFKSDEALASVKDSSWAHLQSAVDIFSRTTASNHTSFLRPYDRLDWTEINEFPAIAILTNWNQRRVLRIYSCIACSLIRLVIPIEWVYGESIFRNQCWR